MVHGAKLLAGDNAMVWTAAQAMGRVLGLGGNRAVRRLIPSVPVFVHKQVAAESLAHKREWQVDSLVEIPFNMTAMSDYSVLRDPAVTIFDPHWCLRGTCLGAMRVNVSMGFGEGRTWIDYLVQDPGDNPLVTAMAQRVRGFGKKNDSED
jgi:hypothetical protein